MIHRPTLTRLRALAAVCRSGSFSLAAEELLLTQPAVSAQIRQLEDETGSMLVERIGKRAHPTPAGKLLIGCAERIFGDLDATLDRIAQMRNEISGPLRIGAGGTAMTYFLPPALQALQCDHPGIELQIKTGNTPDMVDAIHEMRLDIAVVTAPVSDSRLAQEPCLSDQLTCVTPPGEAEGLTQVRLGDLGNRRLILYEPGGLIRSAIDGWLARDSDVSLSIIDIGDAEALKSLVEWGLGWAITSEVTVREDAKRGRLHVIPLSPPLHRQLVTIWHRDRTENPVIAAARKAFARF